MRVPPMLVLKPQILLLAVLLCLAPRGDGRLSW